MLAVVVILVDDCSVAFTIFTGCFLYDRTVRRRLRQFGRDEKNADELELRKTEALKHKKAPAKHYS